LEGEDEISFSLPCNFHPMKFYLNIFSIDFRVLFNHYFTSFLHFPWLINYNHVIWCTKISTHSLLNWFSLNFIFFEFMVLRMVMSYRLQTTQMNDKLPQESSLDLTQTHHLRDENFELWKFRLHLEIEPLQVLYYWFFLNFHTLVILLQVDPIYNDEPGNVCEGFYETENILIFAWSLVPNIIHYR
jgi:hypothetical protein